MVIGSAFDIVTRCRVPRYFHNDLPLGNPLGPPEDRETQLETVRSALDLVASATGPTVTRGTARWDSDDSWKSNYMRLDNPEQLRLAGIENRAKRKAEIDAGLRRPSLA